MDLRLMPTESGRNKSKGSPGMGMRHKAVRWLGVLSVCFAFGMSFTTFAAEISSVNIYVKNNYTEGEITEPTVTLNTSGCTIEDISWSKELSQWKPGKDVQMEITLSASGRTFSDSYSRSSCKISGADFSSARADDDSTLIVRASYTPVVQLGQTERAAWSDANMTKAVWKKVDFATSYYLRLYRDDSVIKTLTLTANNVDLTEYMSSGHTYYYEVRATSKTTSERKYMRDGEFVESENSIAPELGDTSGRWSDNTQGSKYRDESGNYVVNSWKMIFGKWYYFNAEGYASTGWLQVDGKWYYLDAEGVMKTGWLQLNGTWYCLDTNGVMMTGWIQPQPGTWYYLDTNGAMLTNTTVDNCRLDANGIWVQ